MNKKTKKLVLIIIAAVLAVALVTVGTIYGIKYIRNYVGDTVISFESKTALAGDNVKLPISIIKNHGIWGGQIIVSYDADTLEFVSCANGDVFDECETNSADGTVNLVVNQTEIENNHKNGIIATLNFKIKENAQNGDYTIQFDETTNFCDKDAQLIELTLNNGIITVK